MKANYTVLSLIATLILVSNSHVYDQHTPASKSYIHLLEGLKSYFKDFPKQLKQINKKLTPEANRILKEVSTDKSINKRALEKDIDAIVQKHYNSWIEKHKPK